MIFIAVIALGMPVGASGQILRSRKGAWSHLRGKQRIRFGKKRRGCAVQSSRFSIGKQDWTGFAGAANGSNGAVGRFLICITGSEQPYVRL